MSSQNFTPSQIESLQKLGLNPHKIDHIQSNDIKNPLKLDLKNGQFCPDSPLSSQNNRVLSIPKIAPLLSISSFTLLSFGGLILLKNQSSSKPITPPPSNSSEPTINISPTQVPKSIQHYLLTSQQYFTQALQSQTTSDQQATIELLNQSIIAASDAIQEFPSDYRGFEQRSRIYQSLLDSQPQFIDQAIADLSSASRLNPNSAELTRSLATLFAKKGDAQNTLVYLAQTATLEPTKAQNFYDLAKIQQQAGMLPQALDTYNRLIPLISDPNQKTKLIAEKTALENLISQNPTKNQHQQNIISTPTSEPNLDLNSKLIQADSKTGLIIAAPEENKSIAVSGQTDSNSLSGTSTLPSGQTTITLQNSYLSAESQIYLSPIGSEPYLLQVISKTDKSFTVGLPSPVPSDVQFKWWISN